MVINGAIKPLYCVILCLLTLISVSSAEAADWMVGLWEAPNEKLCSNPPGPEEAFNRSPVASGEE